MTASEYFTPLLGQSLYFPGQSVYKGECVQTCLLWITQNGGTPPIYAFAYQYYENGVIGYTKIPVGQPIQDGDIIVWGSDFPPSGGDGHMDVANGSGIITDFSGFDSNWSPPLELNEIHHTGINNTYIVGYLRKEEEVMLDTNFVTALWIDLFGVGPTPEQLTQYIGTPWETSYNELRNSDAHRAFVTSNQAAHDQVTALQNERDTVLYPFVTAVTAALNIPDTADVAPATAAIQTINTDNSTVLQPGLYRIN